MRTRIRIDRLVLDGLPAGTTAAEIERAIRSALATGLGTVGKTRAGDLPAMRLQGRTSSVEAAAGDVAGAVAGLAGGRR